MIAITEREFRQLTEFIHVNYGIHLKPEKMTLVNGRLRQVLEQGRFRDFGEYYDYLVADRSGDAVVTLVDRITTNHTFFMREPDHFFHLRDSVLPWLAGSVRDQDLRIWCAACSTGEESYTLAMILDEFFGQEKRRWDTKVLATDISEKVLQVARQGVYSNERIAPLPFLWRTQYFRTSGPEHSVVAERLKQEVIYRNFNLMDPLPFRRRFHVIFCRNVMIYFDNETKRRLVERLYDHLEYGGYLFIGHSESINRETTRFKYVMPAVYRKV